MKANKIVSVICGACILVLLAGCAAQLSPEDTVKSFFTAVKSGDTAKMQALTSDGSASSSAASSSSTDENDEMTKLILQKIDGQIEGSAQIDGDTATVKVKITAPDMKTIMGNAITKAMKQAMADALSGKSSTTSSNASSAMMQEIQDELSQSDVTLKTSEVEVELVKQNNQWLIKPTDDFNDAITGGLYSAMQSLSGSLSSEK